ncbi:MAG: purine-binding chemotaxis protein CheW [Treponema sp.]|nr:purine-binding chemotaxis protein CheW [Treponema sp.]
MIQQYLTFKIEDTQYAINVFSIQEVLEYEEPVKIPCSSPLLTGLIRSRDQNIAVMDIRQRFGLSPKSSGIETRIIVLEITDQEHGVVNLFGIVADEVLEVIDVDDTLLEPLAKSKKFFGAEFVSDVIRQDDSYILVLDTKKLFAERDITNASKSAQQQTKTKKWEGKTE